MATLFVYFDFLLNTLNLACICRLLLSFLKFLKKHALCYVLLVPKKIRLGFSFEIHDNMFKNTFHSKISVSPHATINKILVPEIPVDYNSISKSGF